jgi:hypothetical protein
MLAKGLLGNSGNDRLVARKWAHGTFSLVVAKCMAIIPPLKAHRCNVSCQNGSFIGSEGEAGGRPRRDSVFGCLFHENGSEFGT